MIHRRSLSGIVLVAFTLVCVACAAQDMVKYEPAIASLDRHEVPFWYTHAKLGIFIHWGLYSVPGWAPLSHPEHDFDSPDYIKFNPYAEWYFNTMRIDGSPT
jgi:alpha-L-fucosidase